MVPYLGDFAEDATVYIPFNTFSSDDPSASATITNLADADIKVHKDGSTTEIVTDGASVVIDFDGVTGGHLITVDTSAHADYATGSDYLVRIEGTTVDGATVNAWVGQFSIENRTTYPKADMPTNFSALGIESDGDVTKVNSLDGHTAQTGDTFAALPTNFADLAITSSTGYVDVGAWLGTTVATPTTAGVPEVDITYVGGQAVVDDGAGRIHAVLGNVAHGGSATSITADHILLSSTGVPLTITSTTGNEAISVSSASAVAARITSSSDHGVVINTDGAASSAVRLTSASSGVATFAAIAGSGPAWQATGNVTITDTLNADVTGNRTGSVSGSVGSVTGNVAGSVEGNVDGNVAGSVGSLGATAKTEVNAEVDTALSDIGLDHLLSASVAGTDVTDDSVVAQLVSASATADWDDYDNTTDALEAIRDRGDSAWTTGAGGTPPDLLQSTTIATLSSQTSFTLTAGSADDDAYNGAMCVVTDSATSTQIAVGTVGDYTGSTKTVTLSSDPGIFTMGTGDTVDIVAVGSATVDTAAIADAVLDEALSGHTTAGTLGKAVTDIETDATAIVADTNELQGDWVDGGRLDLLLDAAYTGGDITGNLSGSVGSVTGAVGSVTGNVGGSVEGNVDGSVASVTAGVTLGNVSHGGTGADLTLASATLSGNLTAGNFAGSVVGDITGNLSGSVGSVTGAVGSVTGNVGAVTGDVGGDVAGNVAGSVASVTGNINTAAGTITTLDALDTAQDTQHATTQSDLGNLNDLAVSDILTTQMTESYAADGTAPTLAQALFIIQQTIGDFAINGTTITVKKLDGTTTAATYTLDDGTTPTSRTRAT